MKKAVKIWLIVAASLVLLGGIIFVGAMSMMKWDFLKFDTSKTVTNSYDITDSFEGISVSTSEAGIEILKSSDDNCKVVCHERETVKHSVAVTDGKLTVNVEDGRKWYHHISFFSISQPMITVYLPESEYTSLSLKGSTGDISVAKDFSFGSLDINVSTGDVKNHASVTNDAKIKASTGYISVENVSVGSLELAVNTGHIKVNSVACENALSIKVSTGKTEISDIRCKNFSSTGDTGKITMENVIVAEKLSIERSTGDVKFDGCDAAEIFVKTDTGDVEGSLLTEKIFMAKTDTGKVEHPKTSRGGICEITTDTGDIKIFLK